MMFALSWHGIPYQDAFKYHRPLFCPLTEYVFVFKINPSEKIQSFI